MPEFPGLHRTKVVLHAYHENWNSIFLETRDSLIHILDTYDFEIEHIGSTSIPGLAAKPILDIAIGLASMGDLDDIRKKLEAVGFIYRGDTRGDGEFLFVQEKEKDTRTHHLHVLDKNSASFRDYLLFRNKLRENDMLREAYQELKKTLAKKFENDRGAYTRGKASFIQGVLAGTPNSAFMKAENWEIGVIGGPEKRVIDIVDYDPQWPEKFAEEAHRIQEALGAPVISIEHIGSTSVPALAAKPIIDILLVVEDSGDEGSYLQGMLDAGYQLRVREPDFHEHRMFRTPERDVHIHVFSEGCEEIDRYLVFRNQLRVNDQDRQDYEAVKRKLASEDWEDMNAYAEAKTKIIERILSTGFANFKSKNKP